MATGASPKPSGKGKEALHFLWTPATDVGKADTKKHRTAKLWMQHAEDVERKDTMRRFASRGNMLHTLSRSSTGFQHQLCRGRDQ